MNRRQKIIVSVVGIFLVLLILVGLTYAYFLTRIQGNTKSTSITVKTANLALVYGDGNGTIGSETNTIKPGDEIGSKTFTVKNEGNATTGYVVVIEDVLITDYNKDKTNLEDDSVGFKSNDFRYTLTCESDGEACNGISDETVFPMSGGIVVGNNIEVGKTQTFTLTVVYKETGENQSDDMNKGLTAKVNIKDIKEINPYSDNTSSLAYNIINNAKLNKNGTELKTVPDTIPAKNVSGRIETGKYEEQELDMSAHTWYYADTYDDAQPWNGGSYLGYVSECSDTIVGKYISYPAVSTSWYVKSCKSSTVAVVRDVEVEYEQALNVTVDDYGTSYYYRGAVENNYVNFAGMCWRIVRIEGDGSTKLILEDYNTTCDSSTFTGDWRDGNEYVFGADGSGSQDYLNYSGGLADAFKTFQTSKLSSVLNKLKADEWCFDDTVTETSSYGYDDNHNTVYNKNEATQVWIVDKKYGAYTRLYTDKNSSLNCTGTKLTKFSDGTDMYVATLTADEIAFAGGKVGSTNQTYYLMNNYVRSACENSKYIMWASLSLCKYYLANDAISSSYFYFSPSGQLGESDVVHVSNSSRPSIVLKAGTIITSGDGTIENPYIVE